MREIKFRAWEFKHKSMSKMAGYFGYSPYNNKNNYAWMQYIGRKDKNGVEIYERDILKDGNCIFVVPSIDELIDMAFEENSFASFEDCEIIGNIYENPKLLKD